MIAPGPVHPRSTEVDRMTQSKRAAGLMVVTNDCEQLYMRFVLNGREQMEFETVSIPVMGHAARCISPHGPRLGGREFEYAKPIGQLGSRTNLPSFDWKWCQFKFPFGGDLVDGGLTRFSIAAQSVPSSPKLRTVGRCATSPAPTSTRLHFAWRRPWPAIVCDVRRRCVPAPPTHGTG
jgi:hypothetical protein